MVALSRFHRLAALCMALAATGVALCLSVAVAWHRVPVLWEQVLGAAVAVLVTLGVHLLPALANALIRAVRGGIQAAVWCLGVGLLWLVGMVWVLYGHAEPVSFLVCRGHETITEMTSYDRCNSEQEEQEPKGTEAVPR
jgi:hypothetical protein